MKFTLIGSAPAGLKPSTSGLFINEVYHRQLVLKSSSHDSSWVLKAPEVLQNQEGRSFVNEAQEGNFISHF